MNDRFGFHDQDEGLRRYFEVDEQGWAVRQVEVREADSVPVTAV